MGRLSNLIDIDDEPLESGFESDWLAEPEAVAPKGDDTVAKGTSALQEVIGRHKAIDTDAEWDDIDLFLPIRALPLAYDEEKASVVCYSGLCGRGYIRSRSYRGLSRG